MRNKGLGPLLAFQIFMALIAFGLLIAVLVLRIRISESIIVEQIAEEAPMLLGVLISSTNSHGLTGLELAGRSIVIETPPDLEQSQAGRFWKGIVSYYQGTGRRYCADVLYLKEGISFDANNVDYFIEGHRPSGDKCGKRFGIEMLLPVPYNNNGTTEDALVKVLVHGRD